MIWGALLTLAGLVGWLAVGRVVTGSWAISAAGIAGAAAVTATAVGVALLVQG